MKFKFRSTALAGLILSAGLLANVANAGIIAASETGYTQVYGLNIGTQNLHSGVPYYLDISTSVANDSFDRIAYHMELQKVGGPVEWVWVSMDAFSNDASKIGVPSFAGSNTSFQQLLTNMNIFSNRIDIATGVGLSTGNIEFWPYNYGTQNTAGVPNANGGNYDVGDWNVGSSNYGSMQIHNNANSQTLFALNRFSATNKDLGIGNQVSGHPDWTFAGNSNQYSLKTLDVWVSSANARAVPEPSTLAILALGLLGVASRRFKKQA